MLQVRIFEASGTPNTSTINDVEMVSAPSVGDIVEFQEQGGVMVEYVVEKVIHRFGPMATPGKSMLGVGVRAI